MNWQSVKAAPGQYIQLQAVITEIKHLVHEVYGPYALGKAQDNGGVVEDVFFTIKKGASFPTGLAVGHSCNWSGKHDANTGKTKVWFQNMAQRDVAAQAPVQVPPQAAPAPSQAPPAAPQAANAPYHVPVDSDPRQVSIERQVCVKAVGEMASRQPMDKYATADWLSFFMGWITTGTFPFEVTHAPEDQQPANWDPNQDDSDLPPEIRAGYQG